MTPETPSPQMRRVKKNRGYLWLAGIVVFILIVCVSLYFYPIITLHREVAAIRQKGEPLTTAEAAPPPVPQSQNAAPLYARAMAAMKGVDYWGDPTKDAANDIPQFLHQNIRAIQLIRQAAAKPQCRFNIDWKNLLGDTASLKYDSAMRSLTRFMGMQASYEARTGNTSQALSDIRCMFLMARHESLAPDTIDVLDARAMDQIADATLAKVLLNVSLTPAQAHAFETSLPVIDWNAASHRGLLTERACTMETFDYVRSHSNALIAKNIDPSGKTWPFWVHWRPASDWEETYALRLWREEINLQINAPFPAPTNYGKSFEQKVKQIPEYAIVTLVAFPVFSLDWERNDQNKTLRLEGEIALALAAYHTQYHHYPATLAPAEKLWESPFPNDPYSGKSFRYKNDGKTFLLYSIGANRADDGGAFGGNSNENDDLIKDDIVWRNGDSDAS